MDQRPWHSIPIAQYENGQLQRSYESRSLAGRESIPHDDDRQVFQEVRVDQLLREMNISNVTAPIIKQPVTTCW